MWGGIGTGKSSCQVLDNEIYEAGHEGIDVQDGDPLIEGNVIYDSHAGIVILQGSATVKNNIMRNVGGGIHVENGATPLLENNSVQIAPPDLKKEWRYGDFAYTLFDEPSVH